MLLLVIPLLVTAAPTNLNLDLIVSNTTSTESGHHNATIRIYDSFTGGTVVHTQNVNISLDSQGIGHALLTNIDLKDTGNYFLTIQGNEDQESNRINVTTALYAQRSDNSTFADEASTLTGTITESQISDLVHTVDTFNTTEEVQDAVGDNFNQVNGNGSITYNDANDRWDVITFISTFSWDDLRDIPDGFSDAIDDLGSAFYSIGADQGSNFTADSNETAINFTSGDGNVNITIQGNQIIFNSSDTGGGGADQNLIGDIGSQDGNFSVDSVDNSFNITGGASLLTSISNNILTITMTAINTVITSFTNSVQFDENVTVVRNFSADGDTFVVDATTGRVSIKHNNPQDDFNVNGTMDLDHTATESDDHAFEIHVKADGFGDVKGLEILYETGNIGVGHDEEAILINIDESAATGGAVVGVEVIATEGLATITALEAGAVVNPVLQLSGVFSDMDSALVLDVDRLSEFTTVGSDILMFVADDDNVTIGNSVRFQELEFLLNVVASGAGIKPTFEYSNGSGSWREFNPADGTDGMRNTGVIVWEDDDLVNWTTGNGGEFLIRITRTQNSLTTVPNESKVQIAVTTEFSWDKDGNIFVSTVNATQINATNFTGQFDCTNIFGGTDGDFCADDSGGSAAGDKWADNGDYIYPNESFAIKVNSSEYAILPDVNITAVGINISGQLCIGIDCTTTLPNASSETDEIQALETFLINDSDAVFFNLNVSDWSNVSIVESQISDLSHTGTDGLEANQTDFLINVSNVNEATISNITGGTQTGIAVTHDGGFFDFVLDAVNSVITEFTSMLHASSGFNVTGDVNITGLLNVSGDIETGGVFIGDGGGLTGVSATNVSGNASVSHNLFSTDALNNISNGDVNTTRLCIGVDCTSNLPNASSETDEIQALETFLINDSDAVFFNLNVSDWSNVSITGSQISDDTFLSNTGDESAGNQTVVGNFSVTEAIGFHNLSGIGMVAPAIFWNGTCLIINSTTSVMNTC